MAVNNELLDIDISISVKCDECQGEIMKVITRSSSNVTVEKAFIESILAENEKLKHDLSNLTEDFERLNEIF